MRNRIVAVLIAVAALIAAIVGASFAGVSASAEGATYIYIDSESDWEAFIYQSSQGTGYANSQFTDVIVELQTDLYFYRRNADPAYRDKPNKLVNDFKGIFEGNGHSLVGLRYSSTDASQALFGNIDGAVRNLNIVDVQIEALQGEQPVETRRGGLAASNRGIISNVKIQGTIGGNFAGGITALNSPMGTITDCVSAISYSAPTTGVANFGAIACTNYGTIQNNYNVYGDQVFTNGEGSVYSEPSDTLTSDGKIDSFFELFCFDEDPATVAVLAQDINLYNQNLDWLQYYLDAAALGDYWFYNNTCIDSITPAGFASYTQAEPTWQLADLIIGGTGIQDDPYLLFSEGSGTAQDPYEIVTPQDLMRIEQLYERKEYWETEFGIAADAVPYFALSEDISLIHSGNTYYDISITGFSGVLDGRGKSIAGVIDSLFVSTVSGSEIKRLNLRGEVRGDGEALAVQTNSGTLSDVAVQAEITASGEGVTAGGIVYENAYKMSQCEAIITSSGLGEFGSIAYAVTASGAQILASRSLSGELPFIFTAEGDKIGGCYNGGSIWEGTDTEAFPNGSIACYGGQNYYDGDLYLYLIDDISGWAWTKSSPYNFDFCVLAGAAEDVFVLRLPGDIGEYKIKNQLKFINGSDDYNIERTYSSSGFSENVSDFFDDPYDYDTYSWEYTDPSGVTVEHTEGFSEAKECGTYTFYFVKNPTTAETKGTNTAQIKIIPIRIDYQASDLREKQGNMLLPISGIWAYNAIAREFEADGVYYSFTDIGAIIGGVTYQYSGETQPRVYIGQDIGLSAIKPFYAPANAYVIYEIKRYIYTNGKEETLNRPATVRNAGMYYIDLTITCPNYETDKIEGVMFVVNPKPVGVTPYIDTADGKLPYNTSIASYIKYAVNNTDTLETLTIAELAEMGYTSSNYTQGSPAGEQYDYNLRAYTVKNIHNNYSALGKTVVFKVVKIDIPGINNVVFTDVSGTYNGGYYTIAASGLTENMAVRYAYGGVSRLIPYKFIDAGVYAVTATVFVKDKNGNPDTSYNPAPELTANITVNPKNIAVSVKSYTINYGAAPPAYEINDFSGELCTREDGGTDSFGTPSFTCSPINYASGSDAGLYTIGLSAGSLVNPNYSVNVASGTLTVNKISRGALILNNASKTYDGAVFAPSFPTALHNDIAAMPTDNIVYSRYNESADIWEVIPLPPKDVGNYRIEVHFDNTSPRYNNYFEETLQADFAITTAGLSISFLVDHTPNKLDNKQTVSDYVYSSLVYNGEVHGVQIAGLPVNEIFQVIIRYTKGGFDCVSDLPVSFEFSEAGLYSNINVEVTGNGNYYTARLYGGSILYKQRTLRLNGFQAATYNTKRITPELSILNDSYILAKDKPLNVTYKSYINGVETDILDAGRYTIEADPNNPNYVILNENNDGIYFFDVAKYHAIIDFGEPYKTYYGRISTTFKLQTQYAVGVYSETKDLIYNVAPASGVGSYNVLSINETVNVIFSLLNGGGKYVVLPKTVSFSWGLSGSYVYNGTERTDIKSYTVPDRSLVGREGNDIVGVNLRFDGEIKNCGSYRVTASLSNPNYTLAAGNTEYAFEITKAEVSVTANSVAVDYLSPPPVYTATVSGLRGNDNESAINLVFDCSYTAGANTGEYTINVISFISDNYLCDISDSAGVLTVKRIRQTGLSYPDLEVTYNGKAFTYLPQGFAEGSKITVDQTPTDAGVYTLKATVKLANYEDETIVTTFTVYRAAPILSLTPNTKPYTADGIALSSNDIIGEASYGGQTVTGDFVFENEGETLLFGEHEYRIMFIPDSSNFAVVSQDYMITSQIDEVEDKIAFVFGSGTDIKDGTLYSKDDTIKFAVSIVWGFSSNIVFYVNGVEVVGSIAEIKNPPETVVIEVKKDGVLLSDYTYNVVLNHNPPPDPVDPGTKPDTNPGTKPEIPVSKPIDWRLIGGVAGGVAGGIVIIAIIVIVVRRIKGRQE